MSNQRRLAAIFGTLSVVVLIAAIGTASYVAGRTVRTVDSATDTVDEAIETITGEGEFSRAGEVTIDSILALSELTTVELVEYTVVEKGTDEGILNWATGDKIELFAVARIGAGVDLSQLEEGDVFADPQTGRAIIRLPGSEILYVAVDTEASHVYNRETGVFTKGDPDLERAARLTAEDALVEQAYTSGILDMADERAVKVLEDLLKSLGYDDVDVVVAPRPSPSP